ncbi:MAG: protein TolR [Methylococcales bacterium]
MNMPGQRKRRRPVAEINVIPYIDVSLVLLIIFMITTPLLQTGIEVDLPQAQAKSVVTDNGPPVVVSVDAEGQYFLSTNGTDNELVMVDDLPIKVAAVLRHKPNVQVLVRGDSSVNYGKIVIVMAALKQAGVPNVGLMTRPTE